MPGRGQMLTGGVSEQRSLSGEVYEKGPGNSRAHDLAALGALTHTPGSPLGRHPFVWDVFSVGGRINVCK